MVGTQWERVAIFILVVIAALYILGALVGMLPLYSPPHWR